MKQELIAITGRKFAGKDTVAQILAKQRDMDIIKFADPLKEMLRAMYRLLGASEEIIERKIEGDLKEEPCPYLDGRTPRFAMQKLGTEWRQMISEHLWVLQTGLRLGSLKKGVVISDLRFEAEAKAVRGQGGKILRVVRPSVTANDFSNHVSETEMDGIEADITIINDGSIADLKKKLEAI